MCRDHGYPHDHGQRRRLGPCAHRLPCAGRLSLSGGGWHPRPVNTATTRICHWHGSDHGPRQAPPGRAGASVVAGHVPVPSVTIAVTVAVRDRPPAGARPQAEWPDSGSASGPRTRRSAAQDRLGHLGRPAASLSLSLSALRDRERRPSLQAPGRCLRRSRGRGHGIVLVMSRAARARTRHSTGPAGDSEFSSPLAAPFKLEPVARGLGR